MSRFLGLLILSCVIGSVLTAKTSFTIGTVDYLIKANNTVADNLEEYFKIVKEAQSQHVDILVFPESALFGSVKQYDEFVANTVEIPDGDVIPCSLKDPKKDVLLQKLSCAAIDSSMYLVINLIERDDSKDSSGKSSKSQKFTLYNTDVVIDRNGQIIASYRKYHLFGEPGISPAKRPEWVTFTTDFNEVFGLCICNDLIYENPCVQMVRSKRLSNLITNQMWVSSLPFLVSTQYQQSWAYGNAVNLFTSGSNRIKTGAVGSSIILGTNPDAENVVVMPTSNRTTLIVAKVDKDFGEYQLVRQSIKEWKNDDEWIEVDVSYKDSNTDSIYTVPDDLVNFKSLVLKTSQSSVEEYNLCFNQLCCRLIVNTTVDDSSNELKSYQYRFVIFNGIRTSIIGEKLGLQVCGIIHCTGSEYKTCGNRFPDTREVNWPVTFNTIELSGNFKSNSDVLTMPNTLTSRLVPIPKTKWSFKTMENERTEIFLTAAERQLMSFGIYNRDFSMDS